MASNPRNRPMAAATSEAILQLPTRPREGMSLEEAVKQAQTGDVAAFETLYRGCSGRVYALCLRLTADKSAAENLSQDVFVRAWQKLDTFRGECAFTTWLHRLAVNVVLQDRRSTMRRKEREKVEGERRPTADVPHGAVDAGMDLERAVAMLPERARTVLVLHDVEGYQHKEIAEVMSVSVGTCKAQLHRARKMLREALS